MQSVNLSDICAGFEKLDITGKKVVVHSSLRSFGYVEGGAETVAEAMINSFDTVLVPGFSWESNAPPPPYDRPKQNGCHYSFYDNWTKPLKPFIVECAGIEPKIGVISKKLASMPNSRRSDHAWYSWIAYGSSADYLVKEHPWEIAHLPLEKLSKLGGYLVLMGVSLTSCTAIHLAEEYANRKSFIRWAVDKNGTVRRVKAGGCSKGFDNLIPHCQSLFSETYVGNCRILSTPLAPFVNHIASVIRNFPELTRCSESCIRCHDAILGGTDT